MCHPYWHVYPPRSSLLTVDSRALPMPSNDQTPLAPPAEDGAQEEERADRGAGGRKEEVCGPRYEHALMVQMLSARQERAMLSE